MFPLKKHAEMFRILYAFLFVFTSERVFFTSSEIAPPSSSGTYLDLEHEVNKGKVNLKDYYADTWIPYPALSSTPKANNTIVTAYFEMPCKHSHAEYITWMANMLSLQDAMVIYTTKDMVSEIKLLRAHAIDRTLIIPTQLKFTKVAREYSTEFWKSQFKIDPERKIHLDVRLYWVWLSKTEFLKRTVDNNPFQSTYFAWVDIGYFRTKKYNGQTMLQYNLHPSKITLLEIPKGSVGGGFIGGGASVIDRWNTLFYKMIDTHKDKFIGKDQPYMRRTCNENPGLCKLVVPNRRHGDPWFFIAPYMMGLTTYGKNKHVPEQTTNIPVLQWIDIPKTGSMWLNVTYHTCCGKSVKVIEPLKEKFKDCTHCDTSGFRGGHRGVNETSCNDIVAIFREPKERVKSGFFSILHDCPSMQKEYCYFKKGAVANMWCNYTTLSKNLTETFSQYWRCVEGCSVKMFSGSVECRKKEYTKPSASEVSIALSNLNKPSTFVGLSTEYEQSSAKFHENYNGDSLPLKHVPTLRKRPKQFDEWLPILDDIIEKNNLTDSADSALYDAAVSKFMAQNQTHLVLKI